MQRKTDTQCTLVTKIERFMIAVTIIITAIVVLPRLLSLSLCANIYDVMIYLREAYSQDIDVIREIFSERWRK